MPKEFIDKDLEPLVKRFIENSYLDLKKMYLAFKSEQFLDLKRLGHNIKGSSRNYGFMKLSDFGRSIEVAASQNDKEEIKKILLSVENYLETVEIEYL